MSKQRYIYNLDSKNAKKNNSFLAFKYKFYNIYISYWLGVIIPIGGLLLIIWTVNRGND